MGIAKSIAKWTINTFSESSFLSYVKSTHRKEIQSKRGVIGGKIGGRVSHGGGRKKFSVDVESINQRKPWLKLNISRSTWYRKHRHEN